MRRVRSASRRVRKTGAVPVLGLTRAKSSGLKVKPRFGIVLCVLVSVQEEGAASFREGALRSADDEGAELECGRGCRLEEGRLVGSEAAVLEVVDAGDAAGG